MGFPYIRFGDSSNPAVQAKDDSPDMFVFHTILDWYGHKIGRRANRCPVGFHLEGELQNTPGSKKEIFLILGVSNNAELVMLYTIATGRISVPNQFSLWDKYYTKQQVEALLDEWLPLFWDKVG